MFRVVGICEQYSFLKCDHSSDVIQGAFGPVLKPKGESKGLMPDRQVVEN